MAKEQGPMSGFRDLLAEQMLPRDEVLNTIKSVYELYGFVPLKTPALERHATLTGKYGDEGEGLMYSFEDNGGRKVAMRYDQTVPLARVVAQHGADLPTPYKRYALGDVWRGESPQAGRYREFTQFDADIVGTTSNLADTEIIAMMSDAMGAIGVDALIRVNDRRLLDGLAKQCGVEDQKTFLRLVSTIDKVEKIGSAAVLEEVKGVVGPDGVGVVKRFLGVTGDSATKLDQMSGLLTNEVAQEAITGLSQVLGALAYAGYDSDKVVFDQTIARGLSYYTGTIYETSLKALPEIGSVCSGGRFDKLIEQMGGPDTPAVGTSIGVDRLLEGMRQLDLLKVMKTKTQVYITNVSPGLDNERFALAQRLRAKGVASEIVYGSAKLKKQLRDIDRLGVPEIILIGENEIEKGVGLVKNMGDGTQVEVPLADIASRYTRHSE